MKNQWGYKILSVVLASVLWVVLTSRKDYEEVIVARVQWILPDGFEFVDRPVEVIELKLRGHRRALQKTRQRIAKEAFAIDIRSFSTGSYVRNFSLQDFNTYEGVTLLMTSPSTVALNIKRKDEKALKNGK